jgi:hypothetical protein
VNGHTATAAHPEVQISMQDDDEASKPRSDPSTDSKAQSLARIAFPPRRNVTIAKRADSDEMSETPFDPAPEYREKELPARLQPDRALPPLRKESKWRIIKDGKPPKEEQQGYLANVFLKSDIDGFKELYVALIRCFTLTM